MEGVRRATHSLGAYLFKEDASLADEYLEACARYLDAYIPLLGPYPFPKFAVVENFFSSGLGMPSFTLLGSAIIKRHYTQPYAWVMKSSIHGLEMASITVRKKPTG